MAEGSNTEGNASIEPRIRRRDLAKLATGLFFLGALPAMAETIQDLSKELQSTRRFLAHMNTLVDGIIRSRKLIGRDEAQELRVNNSLEEALASTKTIRGKVEAINIQPLSDAELDELAKQTSMTRDGVGSVRSSC